MLITLDNLAHRYQCLPSEALSRATTFDLYVLDVSTKWLRYQQDKADGKNPAARKPSQQEMLDMLKRARGEV
jgi:hypothetical protein